MCRTLKKRGRKGTEKAVGKRAGGECLFNTRQRVGLADDVGSDAMADMAGR
jgi:hypothetical protein